jgi:hypothetical protein
VAGAVQLRAVLALARPANSNHTFTSPLAYRTQTWYSKPNSIAEDVPHMTPPTLSTLAVLTVLATAPVQGASHAAFSVEPSAIPGRGSEMLQFAQTSQSWDRSQDRYGPNVDPEENARRYREQNQQRSPFVGRNPAICDQVAHFDTSEPSELFRYMQSAYREFLQQVQLAGGDQNAPSAMNAAALYWCYAGKLGYSQANPPPFTPER